MRAGGPTAKRVPPQALPIVGRVRTALAGLASVSAWRIALAVLVALLVYWTVAGGTIRLWPGAQVALALGVTVGLIAPGPLLAAAVAGLVYAIGVLTGPSNFLLLGSPTIAPIALLPWAVLAAAVGAACAYALGRRWLRPGWLWWFAVTLVAANMWITVTAIDALPMRDVNTGVVIPALSQLMRGAEAPEEMKRADDYLYVLLDRKMRSGLGYYEASEAAFTELDFIRPSVVLNVRQPLFYRFISALPDTSWAIWVYLLLVTGAAVSVRWALRDVVRAPLVLPAVFAVIAYSVANATSSHIYYAEAWAGPLVLVAFALYVTSLRAERWRAWLIAALAVATLAFFVRELAGVLFIAGVAATLAGPGERRTWSLVAWGAGALVAGSGYVAHVLAVRPYLSSTAEQMVGLRGGLSYSLSALTNGTPEFGVALAIVLAILAYLGALCLPRTRGRLFALVVLVLPLVLFLFVGNGATDTLSGIPINYWGGVIVPMAYACLPAALAAIPGSAPADRPAS